MRGDAARLRALFSAYARTTIGRYDIRDVLYRLTDQALGAIGVDGAGVSVADLRELPHGCWGEYPAFAVEHGCLALAALPMVADDQAVGALDVYRHEAGPWDEETLEDAQLVADVARHVVDHRELPGE